MTFEYIGHQHGKRCFFCGASVSVKYLVSVNNNSEKVYACNKCVALRIGRGEAK